LDELIGLAKVLKPGFSGTGRRFFFSSHIVAYAVFYLKVTGERISQGLCKPRREEDH
jgi:hypothetical protein